MDIRFAKFLIVLLVLSSVAFIHCEEQETENNHVHTENIKIGDEEDQIITKTINLSNHEDDNPLHNEIDFFKVKKEEALAVFEYLGYTEDQVLTSVEYKKIALAYISTDDDPNEVVDPELKQKENDFINATAEKIIDGWPEGLIKKQVINLLLSDKVLNIQSHDIQNFIEQHLKKSDL